MSSLSYHISLLSSLLPVITHPLSSGDLQHTLVSALSSLRYTQNRLASVHLPPPSSSYSSSSHSFPPPPPTLISPFLPSPLIVCQHLWHDAQVHHVRSTSGYRLKMSSLSKKTLASTQHWAEYLLLVINLNLIPESISFHWENNTPTTDAVGVSGLVCNKQETFILLESERLFQGRSKVIELLSKISSVLYLWLKMVYVKDVVIIKICQF